MPFPSFVYPFSLVAPTLSNSTATSTKKGAHHISNTLRRNATIACTAAIGLSSSLLLVAAHKPSGKTGDDDDYGDETPSLSSLFASNVELFPPPCACQHENPTETCRLCRCHCHCHCCAERQISEPTTWSAGAGIWQLGIPKKLVFGDLKFDLEERASLDTRLVSPSRRQQNGVSMLPSPHAPRFVCGMNHRLRVAKKPIFFYITYDTNYCDVRIYIRLSVSPRICPYKQVLLCARKRRLSCASQESMLPPLLLHATQNEARNEGLEWRAGGVSRQKGTMRSMRGVFFFFWPKRGLRIGAKLQRAQFHEPWPWYSDGGRFPYVSTPSSDQQAFLCLFLLDATCCWLAISS